MKIGNPYEDDTFLARWLNDDLSPKELLEFESTEEHKKYRKIIQKVDSLKPPTYNKKRMLSAIQESIQNEKRTVPLFPKWGYGIAASIVALIGIFLFFDTNKTTFETGFGEQLTVNLPDGSEVILNSKSLISFNESEWSSYRQISLEGEAFFKVEKGTPFIVATNTGSVQVLGTQFNVNTRKDYFEVICTEGKVKAISDDKKERILTKGNAFRKTNDQSEIWKVDSSVPGWMSGETSFTNTPLRQVILSLENQFDIKFNRGNIDEKLRFTGSYSNDNIELALKTIFVPMEINYKVLKGNVIKLSKN